MAIQNFTAGEKRAFRRLSTTAESCAVVLTPGHIVSFCMLDISKAGLAFCYDGKTDASKLFDNVTATIFTDNSIASDISVQIISDTQITEELFHRASEKFSAQNRYLRRCGIKFNSLSHSQEKTLENYIQKLETN